MGLSLKGPPKQGSSDMDEGDLTRAVVASYAAEDGLDGQAEAAKVLPARRALWRLVEAHAPQRLAAALRARLDRADQTGRGGVRELRRALADWLDPPPTCGRCGRAMSPDLMADPATAACPVPPQRRRTTAAKPRTEAERARRGIDSSTRLGPVAAPRAFYPAPCAPPRGPRAAYGTASRPGPLRAGGVARCGTLALFSPLVLDPACAASVKLMRHGGGLAYDLVVDRDARILLAVTTTKNVIIDAHPAQRSERANDVDNRNKSAATASHLDKHACHSSTSIAAARRVLDHRLDRACRANARLVLATQVKYFSPKAGVTRADLLQAGMMGLRRALLDYDPDFTPAGKRSGVRISSYAINWIHQSMGDMFKDRELVAAPPWAVSLRGKVEALGIAPGVLLAGVSAVAEERLLPVVHRVAADDLAARLDLNRRSDRDPRCDGQDAQGDEGDDEAVGVAHACHSSTASLLAAAASRRPPKSKAPVSDERSREQVAAEVARLLGLECTGGALLTALRYGGAPVFLPVSSGGERDDHDGGGDSPGGGHPSRGLEHLRSRPDGEDEEDAALEEADDRRRMAVLLGALEALQAADPEAAEVVRRRHGLDAAGEEETLEEVGALLRSTGRSLCREATRVAYKRGERLMRQHAAASGLTLALPAVDDLNSDDADDHAPSRPRRSVWRPLRPAEVRTTYAASSPSPRTTSDAPESRDPEAWTPAEMVF